MGILDILAILFMLDIIAALFFWYKLMFKLSELNKKHKKKYVNPLSMVFSINVSWFAPLKAFIFNEYPNDTHYTKLLLWYRITNYPILAFILSLIYSAIFLL